MERREGAVEKEGGMGGKSGGLIEEGDYMEQGALEREDGVSVCTDGAASVTTPTKGFFSSIKEKNPQVVVMRGVFARRYRRICRMCRTVQCGLSTL